MNTQKIRWRRSDRAGSFPTRAAANVEIAHLVAQPGDREGLCGEPISDFAPHQVGMWRQCQGCLRLAHLLAEREGQ
jgi:hypothetical protein